MHRKMHDELRYEVLTAVNIKREIFWHVRPCTVTYISFKEEIVASIFKP
jgi:hypothetical protein